MVIISTRERWVLGPGQYLDVIRNDRDNEVVFAIGQSEPDSRLQERLRFKLSVKEAMRLALFLGNITSLEPLSPFENDTKPE